MAEFRADIEGLRGVAILLVVAYHAGLPLSGGYVGVDVFFVLSGYLITRLLLSEYESSGRISVMRFFARRVRRLVPAAAVMLMATLVLGFAIYSPIELAPYARTAEAVAVYLGNVQFARDATNYLLAGRTDPLLHMWSLSVEEQFYLLWPFLIGGLLWGGAAWRVRGLPRRWLMIAGVGTVAVGSFVLCVHLTRVRAPWAFFLSPTRFWEFAVGALAVLLPVAGLRRGPARVIGLAGLTGIVGAALVMDELSPFPGALAALPALGTAAVLVANAALPADPVMAPLRWPLMQWVGRHSYSWYLWHWPLVVYVGVVWRDPSVVSTVAAALVALGVAVASYRIVERPIRFDPRLVARPGLSVGLGLVVIALVFASASAARARAERQADAPDQRALARVRAELAGSAGCLVGVVETAPAHSCTYGDVGSSTTMVLFGDSHAYQWLPAVDALAKARQWRLVVMTKVSCPSANTTLESEHLRRPYRECQTWRRRSLRSIVRLRPILTLVASADAYVAKDGRADGLHASVGAWRQGIRDTASELASAGLAQAYLFDSPVPGFDVPMCLSRARAALFARQDCTFDRSAAIRPDARRALADALVGLDGVRLVDMTDLICPRPRCEVQRGEMVLYSDTSHLAKAFDASLATQLGARIAPQG